MKFEDVLRELEIEFKSEGHEHCRPGWLQLDCPSCSPNWKHFRLGYNVSGRYMNCYVCGRRGVYQTLAELSGKTYRHIAKLVGDVDEIPRTERIKRGRLHLPTGIGPLRPCHIKYLRNRGFDEKELVQLWEIKGIELAPQLSWSIFIPIFFEGQVVSWTTRSISDEHSGRYISASPMQEAISNKEILYGEDYVRHSIIVCEGVTDVWRIGPGAVATLGVGFSQAQTARIAKYPIRVICFDNEPNAQLRAVQLCTRLQCFEGTTTNVELDAKDPGSASDYEIRRLRKFLV